jgi:GNAT superfamily N-acetyltransferase
MSPETIRSAKATDVEGLVRLFRQLGYPEAGYGLRSRLRAMLADKRADVLVAGDGCSLVGAATIFFVPVAHENGSWCRITALVVDEEHRGRGVGQALVAAAEAAARAAACIRIEATSAFHRTQAHEFYAALGYAREAEHFLKRLPSQPSF